MTNTRDYSIALFLGKIIARLLFAKCIDSMTLQGRRKTLLIGSYILLNGACELKHLFWRCCYDNGNLLTTASVLDRGTQAGKFDVNSVGLRVHGKKVQPLHGGMGA